jgi:hypothetical protein
VPRTPRARLAGLKSELEGIARISAKRARVRKRHNQLTNFALKGFPRRWRIPNESRFDLYVENWKGNRGLLIEAKTDWRGTAGRMQIRLAIGQLYDYRQLFFANRQDNIDLALLLPDEPGDDIKHLLRSLNIHVLWPDGFRIGGTIGRLQ